MTKAGDADVFPIPARRRAPVIVTLQRKALLSVTASKRDSRVCRSRSSRQIWEKRLSPRGSTEKLQEETAAEISYLESIQAALDTAADEADLAGIRKDVDSFVEGAKQFDDLTMLCLEYKGKDQL